MFSVFKSERAKLRDAANNWLYIATKVYHYQKDKLSSGDLERLVRLRDEVKSGIKQKVADERLRSSIESLKAHLEQVGGNYYPRGSVAENVEFFLFALIIYVGFTTFFIKPFKIPTNSMWPTYHGMTGQVYLDEADAPGLAEKAFRLVAFGASNFNVKAPQDGELLVPMVRVTGGFVPAFRAASVKRYFVIPAAGIEYSFYVGNEKVAFKFPMDFDYYKQVIDPIREAGQESPYDLASMRSYADSEVSVAGRIQGEVYSRSAGGNVPATLYLVKTGRQLKKGESILNFDLLTGDQLFVDRMSYHFVEPKVGDGFVFKTGDIPLLGDDKFYIKRLAGTPGDSVEIKGTGLYVNGEPATGSTSYAKNANQVPPYQGYTSEMNQHVEVDLSQPVTVPEDSFLALGDNSHNSLDSRGWGFVPAHSVVGRPILIYYPFTKRFGVAE